MNYIREYNSKIQSGEIKTSRRVKAVYARLVKEMDDENSSFYFDEEAAMRPIEFTETFCKQSQGELGADLKLELFQKAYIQALFGFLEKETGFRRFNETMFLVGRKNGKTTLLSSIALYMLIADYEGAAEIYSVATKKDQAKKCLTEAVNMVKQSPELRAVLKKRRNDLYFSATSSIFEALASDSNTLDGLNSHAVIIDELHAIKDRNLYEVMKQSMSARRQPLLVMITTAGTVRECIFDDKYDYKSYNKHQYEKYYIVSYKLDMNCYKERTERAGALHYHNQFIKQCLHEGQVVNDAAQRVADYYGDEHAEYSLCEKFQSLAETEQYSE